MLVQLHQNSLSKCLVALGGLLLSVSGMSSFGHAQQPRFFGTSKCDSYCDADGRECCDYDWSGAYVGLQGGWSFLDPNPVAPNHVQEDSDGFSGGVHGGFNRQRGKLVYGIELDYTLTDLDATAPCFNPAFDCGASSDWNASVRGRFGIAFDRLLLFGTAGFAFADYEGFTQLIATGVTYDDEKTLTGGTYGGGLEYAVSERLRVRSEYRYSNFGTEEMSYDSTYTVDPDLHSVIFGASFAF
ncbi:outer membrane protein [Rosistilla oblonga]|uniref:OmpA-like transmembrane domain protein n=1 Tax=Rosistilla oblonga TaxID=2527990 RepID=A0A518IM72_9BACT|nr:outer membrane beta-barrel protein [Rosistilla oblonga]QDV54181.1 OmpA-like transmembrane domain protein [Rosistilla oblonga]